MKWILLIVNSARPFMTEDLAQFVPKLVAYPLGLQETGDASKRTSVVWPSPTVGAAISLESSLVQAFDFGSNRDDSLVGDVMCSHLADHQRKSVSRKRSWGSAQRASWVDDAVRWKTRSSSALQLRR